MIRASTWVDDALASPTRPDPADLLRRACQERRECETHGLFKSASVVEQVTAILAAWDRQATERDREGLMAGHTPGPWVWREDQLVPVSAEEPYYDPIVETDSGVYGPRGADRTLIAAAPELLQALKDLRELAALCFRVIADTDHQNILVQRAEELGLPNGIGVRADAAIAKAEAR